MMLPEGRGRGSTPAGTRTRNLRIRNPLLCPIELRAPKVTVIIALSTLKPRWFDIS